MGEGSFKSRQRISANQEEPRYLVSRLKGRFIHIGTPLGKCMAALIGAVFYTA